MVWLGIGDISATALVIGILTYWIVHWFLRRRKNLPPGPLGIPVFGVLPQLLVRGASVGKRKVFQDWYSRYGPIYCLQLGSANVVLLNDYHLIKDALDHPDIQDRIDYTMGRPGEGAVSSSGQVWREQRKFLHQYFRESGVGKVSIEERVAAEAEFLTEALLKFEGNSLDLEHYLNSATSNVMSAVSFGQRFSYDDQRFHKVLEKINGNIASGILKMGLSLFFPFTKFLTVGEGKRMRDNVEVIFNFYSEIKDEHEANLNENDIRDVMDAYMVEIKKRTGSDLGEFFNKDNMFWIIRDLIFGGTETNTTTLRWAFLFLLHNPDVETKLRSQLDSVVGGNRLPQYSDRASLPYLEAVISEALRLGTASSISLPHVASSDVTFHGYHLPKGTIVIPNFQTLFTQSSNWKELERFWPERFLDDEGKYVKREDFFPFSTGRRSCLGESLSRMELFMFISHTMQKMKFSVPEGQEMPTLEGDDGFTYHPKPYKVLIQKYKVE